MIRTSYPELQYMTKTCLMFVGLNKVKVGQCKSECGTETGSTNNNYVLSKFVLL